MRDYTITPDCNYFEYVVQAYLNSIYIGAFIGTITPRRVEDEPSIRQQCFHQLSMESLGHEE